MGTRSSPSAGNPPNWRREALAVFAKDWLSELRARHALAAIVLFALVSLLLMTLFVRTEGPGLTSELKSTEEIRTIILSGDQTQHIYRFTQTLARAQILSALFWLVMFFSAMAGLPRVFAKEEESGTMAVLRLSARPSAVFAGKLLFNCALMLFVGALLAPFFVIALSVKIAQPGLFVATVALGALSLAGAATLLGAIVARAGGRGYLMLVIGFVPLFPALALGVLDLAAAIHGDGGNHALASVSYLVAMVTVSAFLFEAIWDD